jgi:hypothetical protein
MRTPSRAADFAISMDFTRKRNWFYPEAIKATMRKEAVCWWLLSPLIVSRRVQSDAWFCSQQKSPGANDDQRKAFQPDL